MPIFKRRSWQFQNTPDLLNLMDLEPCYGHVKKIKVFQNWFDIQFRKAVFMQLRFWLFSGPKLTQKLIVGGVLESSEFFSDNNHQKDDFWGWFGIVRISSWSWAQRFWKLMKKWPRKLKLKLATPIWKLTEKQKNDFCGKSANFNINFLCHFCTNFQNLCAHNQEEILAIPKHPQKSSFWWVLAKKTAKNEVAQKLLF